MNTFVTAHWSDLILLSYRVPDTLVSSHIGPFELDKWQGNAYVSVVGFHFGKTRIVGIPPGPLLPDVANFAQWNLRTYVRTPNSEGRNARSNTPDESRGVVFIKEFVPSPMVTGLVRYLYKENYVTTRLSLEKSQNGEIQNARYDMEYGGKRHSMSAQTTAKATLLDAGSADYFFTERYWGSPGGKNKSVISFQIEHAPWKTYSVESHVIAADYGVLYGDEWRFLNDCTPDYVTWCDGSSVGISWPTRTANAHQQ